MNLAAHIADVSFQSDWLDVLRTTFMRHAFLGGSLVALASGLIGYFTVVRQNAFAAHTLAHIGFKPSDKTYNSESEPLLTKAEIAAFLMKPGVLDASLHDRIKNKVSVRQDLNQ